jgi:hypothetical protein
MGSRDDVDIDDIGRVRSSSERADVVCIVVTEWHDVAAPQKAPQLSLSAGPAHLRDHWSRCRGYKADL